MPQEPGRGQPAFRYRQQSLERAGLQFAGVGGICIAAARLWPNARVVGLEPARAPLAEARANVAASGVADRIELRPIRLDELSDIDAFDTAWLPQVF